MLQHIPFTLDAASLLKLAGVKPDGPEAGEFMELVDAARAQAHPKALYRECFIEARGDVTVTVEGVTFTSRTLRTRLANVERVFAYVATCGTEMDRIPLAAGDMLAQFWLDVIKAHLLGAAIQRLNEHLSRRYALGRTATMNPGSGDADVWPIEQQRNLFALLGDVHAHIGVRLTDSCLMVPNKTVSGIRFPTEVDFNACQLCHRAVCPSRRAPFDRALWETLQHA